MEASIKAPDGRHIFVEVASSDTIEEIKRRLQEKSGVPPEEQRLVFSAAARVSHEIQEPDPYYHESDWEQWGILSRHHMRECLSEILGTFILVSFGVGSIAQAVLSDGQSGSHLSVHFAWGLGFMMAIFSSGLSGAHLNPAVSLTLAIFGRFHKQKLPGYWLSQLIGAYLGALVVYFVYYQGIHDHGGYSLENGDIFFTAPAYFENQFGAFLSEAVGTAFLLGGIFAQSDPRNYPSSGALKPLVLGLLLTTIGMSFGLDTGASINPARDFGARLMTWMVGWGNKVFTSDDYYFWVPLFAPFVGGLVGAGVYEVMIERQHPRGNY